MRRTLLLMMVAMLVAVMMAITAGPALAAPGNKGQSATQANPNASFGISTAIAHSSGCTFSC